MFFNNNAKIIVYNKPVNMYKGFDNLLSIVITEMKIELTSDTYVLFINAKRNRLKLIFFNHGNIAIFAMRLAGSMQVDFADVEEITKDSFYEMIKNIKSKPCSSRYSVR